MELHFPLNTIYNLGVILESFLLLKEQVTVMPKESFDQLYLLYQLCLFLNQKVTQVLITFQLDYWKVIYMGPGSLISNYLTVVTYLFYFWEYQLILYYHWSWTESPSEEWKYIFFLQFNLTFVPLTQSSTTSKHCVKTCTTPACLEWECKHVYHLHTDTSY